MGIKISMQSAVENNLKHLVNSVGGEWLGIQEFPGREDLIMWNDPKTHSTHALPVHLVNIPNIKKKMSSKDFPEIIKKERCFRCQQELPVNNLWHEDDFRNRYCSYRCKEKSNTDRKEIDRNKITLSEVTSN